MINSVRDAFTPALRTLGYSINETDTVSYTHLDVYKRQDVDWISSDTSIDMMS